MLPKSEVIPNVAANGASCARASARPLLNSISLSSALLTAAALEGTDEVLGLDSGVVGFEGFVVEMMCEVITKVPTTIEVYTHIAW